MTIDATHLSTRALLQLVNFGGISNPNGHPAGTSQWTEALAEIIRAGGYATASAAVERVLAQKRRQCGKKTTAELRAWIDSYSHEVTGLS